MKMIFKVLLGVVGTYAVGKICYEIGKDVGSVEAQLKNDPDTEDLEHEVDNDSVEYEVSDFDSDPQKTEEKAEPEQEPEQTPVKKPGFFDKLKELRSVSKIKDIFTKKDQSVLGKILTNPDGTQINASVENGEIHIKVKPKKRE